MMFLRTESLKQYIRLYPVTFLLVISNIVVWGLMEWQGSSVDQKTLLRFGAMFNLPGGSPEPWRYFASMFLHIGFEHLLFNCFALYVFAPPLERMLGSLRYASFYIISGFAGNVASFMWHPGYYIGAGASGAIYGIYAAYLFLAIFRRDILDKQTRQTVTTIIIVGFLTSLIIPNVDLYAHAGGFIGGFVLIALMVLFIGRKR